MSPRIHYIILQPTSFCNIDCRYCYLPDRAAKHTMGLETVRAAVQRVFESGWAHRDLQIVWHEGEPLVLGPDYYRAALAEIASLTPPDVKVRHSLNTNGTLINDAWCAFFKETDFAVGLSVDGPRDLHDANRRTRAKTGTFDAVMKGLAQLQAAAVPYYVISVLTERSLRDPDRLYDFYVENGIEMVCFNIDEVIGTNTTSSMSGAGAQAEFRAFLRAFWNRIVTDGGRLRVREFDTMFREMFKHPDRLVTRVTTEPFGYLCVDWQGNYSTFSPELLTQVSPTSNTHILGNVHKLALADALASPALLAIKADIDAGLRLCEASCEYFGVCGGGIPANKLYERGTFAASETMYCRLMKQTLADVALEIVDSLAGAPA